LCFLLSDFKFLCFTTLWQGTAPESISFFSNGFPPVEFLNFLFPFQGPKCFFSGSLYRDVIEFPLTFLLSFLWFFSFFSFSKFSFYEGSLFSAVKISSF